MFYFIRYGVGGRGEVTQWVERGGGAAEVRKTSAWRELPSCSFVTSNTSELRTCCFATYPSLQDLDVSHDLCNSLEDGLGSADLSLSRPFPSLSSGKTLLRRLEVGLSAVHVDGLCNTGSSQT